MIDAGPHDVFHDRSCHQVALFIQEFHALDLTRLQENTGATHGALLRALHLLQEAGVVQAEADGYNRRIYTITPGIVVPPALPLPMRGIQQALLRAIATKPGATVEEIAAELKLPVDVVEHYTRKLAAKGRIESAARPGSFQVSAGWRQLRGATSWRTKRARARAWLRRHLWVLIAIAVLVVLLALGLTTGYPVGIDWAAPKPDDAPQSRTIIALGFFAVTALMVWAGRARPPCRCAPCENVAHPQSHRLRFRARVREEE